MIEKIGEKEYTNRLLAFDRSIQLFKTLERRANYTLTHYQMTNFILFQTEELAEDNFKFDENGRKLSKRVENTVGKGEIARYEQFLLFPTVFSKGLFTRGVKRCHCVGMG